MERLVAKEQKCTRTFHGKRCRCEVKHLSLLVEMWEEILTRLPLKSLVISRAVCPSWNIMASNVRSRITHLPQCGVLLSAGIPETYLCLRTKKMTDLLLTDSPQEFAFTSGYHNGCLSDLSFDFNALSKIAPYNGNPIEDSNLCTVSRGLLLIVLDDGTHHVHNPATKEVYIVPKSPVIEGCGTEVDRSLIIRGFEAYGCGYSGFLIVRFFYARTWVEFYSSRVGKWFWFKLGLNDNLRRSSWYLENYVALITNSGINIYFLSSKDHGVVVKLATGVNISSVCGFALPQGVIGVDSRLGECGGCLYLSHLSDDCLSIWKNNYSEVDDAWVQLYRINTTRFKDVYGSNLLTNLGFQDNALTVYLLIKYALYSYDLASDVLQEIAQLRDQDEQISLSNDGEIQLCVDDAIPFTPFMGPLFSPNMRLF